MTQFVDDRRLPAPHPKPVPAAGAKPLRIPRASLPCEATHAAIRSFYAAQDA